MKTDLIKKTTCTLGSIALAVLLLAGCSREPTVSPIDVLPGAGAVAGWDPAGEAQSYGRNNLYDLVNGQADAFFVYGFETVTVQNYADTAGAALAVEIWELASPADAYGLFSSSVSGEPAEIGNAGDAYPGRRVAFWQDRYYVHVRARQELPDAELWAFARTVSAALPAGGERPALVDRLPAGGLVERSTIFFHEEISIQSTVWLGGENLLGLSPETDAVLAQYELEGTPVYLLLVQYPDADDVIPGLATLQIGQIDGVVISRVQGPVLGAVFGEADSAAAGALLSEALEP